jgi:hypothetical protein
VSRLSDLLHPVSAARSIRSCTLLLLELLSLQSSQSERNLDLYDRRSSGSNVAEIL